MTKNKKETLWMLENLIRLIENSDNAYYNLDVFKGETEVENEEYGRIEGFDILTNPYQGWKTFKLNIKINDKSLSGKALSQEAEKEIKSVVRNNYKNEDDSIDILTSKP